MRPAKRERQPGNARKLPEKGKDAIKLGYKANNEGGVKGMMAANRVEIKVLFFLNK